MKEQLSKLKKEALSQYDENLSKNIQGENPIYFSSLIQNLIQNAKLIIEDISIIFVYQIRDFELVKFGLTINSFQIQKSKKIDENSQGNLKKKILVTKVSMFFEFYDSMNITKSKYNDYESPLFEKNEKMSPTEEKGQVSKNYIVNNFDFSIELKLDYMAGLSLELTMTASAILIFLKQRQLRHLTRAIEAIQYYRSDRPEVRPGISNGTVLWWKYACKL